MKDCQAFHKTQKLSIMYIYQFVFWEQGFNKVREGSKILELFEQLNVQIRKWRILLDTVFTTRPKHASVVLNVYIYTINQCAK